MLEINKFAKLKRRLGYLHRLPRIARVVVDLFNKGSNGFIRVLIYHDIHPDEFRIFQQRLTLAAKSYRFIDMNTFQDMIEGRTQINGRNLLLTFDDGFKSNRMVAESILSRAGIKATFFVLPDFISCEDPQEQKQFIANNIYDGTIQVENISDHYAPMSWNDLNYLIESGHTVGSHTRTHARLSGVNSSEVLQEEIIESGDILQKKLGIPIDHFAYPFGNIQSVDAASLKLAASRYHFVFSGIRGPNNHHVSPIAIRRDPDTIEDSLRYFQFILEGGLSAYYYFDRKKFDSIVSSL